MIVCFGEKAINSHQDRPPRHTGGTYVTIYGVPAGKRRTVYPGWLRDPLPFKGLHTLTTGI